MAARPSAPSPQDSGRVVVPKLNLDPVQSLQPWPVLITFCNQELEIPALPAVDWLAALLPQDYQLDDVFPGLLADDDVDWVEEQMLQGHCAVGEFQDIVLDVIEMASARKWWVTLRLIDVARSSWDVLGPELVRVDPKTASLSAWLDTLLIVILRNMDPGDVTMFTLRLEAPPDQEEDPEEMEMDRRAFMALGAD